MDLRCSAVRVIICQAIPAVTVPSYYFSSKEIEQNVAAFHGVVDPGATDDFPLLGSSPHLAEYSSLPASGPKNDINKRYEG